MSSPTTTQLAVFGGSPVRSHPFPEWPKTSEQSEQAVLNVLRSGHWWQSGNGYAERLEEWLAAYHDVSDCVAVANGTQALEISYRALGIGPGDEVLVPALTFFSTASAVAAVGASPIPVDVLPDTLCLDTEDARRKLTAQTKAIVPVHLAGQPADMDAVIKFTSETGLLIVEDAAQSIGARWNQAPAGSFGELSTMSFQSAKLLSGGEGGAILVRDGGELAEHIRLLANCGRPRGSSSYEHIAGATNARISELHAALLLSQTSELEDLRARRELAGLYLAEELDRTGVATVMRIDSRVTCMPWYMVVIRPSASVLSQVTTEEYARALTAEGIPASRMYRPFHRMAAFKSLEISQTSCPVAEEAAQSTVWLHHRLLLDGRAGVHDIVTTLKKLDHHYQLKNS
ncbi:DegT/DnrJ/EryC1/StrS family aminotransferase [Streptomyces asiaticus]|uniref:DegT/DnrJ/EryC1/StrS family aminotransferase n=1 Tax=Streptomyces asiaticus TaxID=114695 RepID=UPI003F660DBB